MTTYGSKDVAFVLIDGLNVLGQATALDEKRSATTDENTAFGDEWNRKAFSGIKSYTLSQEGFYNDAAHSSNEALAGHEGSLRVLCYGFATNAIGKRFVG